MSHSVEIDANLNDLPALKKACEELGARLAEHQNVRMFDKRRVYGTRIWLPGWEESYGNVVVTADGQVVYDNYPTEEHPEGAWGDIRRLEELQERYAYHVGMSEFQTLAEEHSGEVSEYQDGEDLVLVYEDGR